MSTDDRVSATGVWAVVPAKGFARGKSRLDGVLNAAEREDVARSLCAHVLSTLSTSGAIEGVLVATDCPHVELFAEARGAVVIRDDPWKSPTGDDPWKSPTGDDPWKSPTGDDSWRSPMGDAHVCVGSLALVVDRALALVAQRGARAALVVMADLPLLTADDVHALVAALDRAPLVAAPDRAGNGTNALGLAPPNRILTCFGSETSFHRHVARAASEGLALEIHRSEGTAFDLDSPDDLALALTARYAERGARLSWNRKRPSRVSAA